jgi:hypothetical protein
MRDKHNSVSRVFPHLGHATRECVVNRRKGLLSRSVEEYTGTQWRVGGDPGRHGTRVLRRTPGQVGDEGSAGV